MRFSVLIALVAGECYNENDFYEGTATNANCEPWSESEWAWPDMYSIHKRDGNYCRFDIPNSRINLLFFLNNNYKYFGICSLGMWDLSAR